MSQEDDLDNQAEEQFVEKKGEEIEQPAEANGKDQAAKDKQYQLKDIDMASIFVNNLEENTTEEDLREYFKDCGAIQKVTLRTDKNTGTLFAYVQFQDVASVEDAVSLTEGYLKGRKIKVFQKRTNLRHQGRKQMTRGRATRYQFRGRYAFATRPRGGPFRGGLNKFNN